MAGVAAALLGALLLAGCAIGRNFARPDSDMLRLGQSPYAELVQKLGPPYKERFVQYNDQRVREVEYTYVTTYDRDPPYTAGGIPGRTLWLYFADDVLVGHLFSSSWRSDHTDFDTAKAPLIVEGKSTREQVIAMLGRPAGHSIYPMAAEPGGESLRYFFKELWYEKYGNRSHQVNKWLVVNIDSHGIVQRRESYDSKQPDDRINFYKR